MNEKGKEKIEYLVGIHVKAIGKERKRGNERASWVGFVKFVWQSQTVVFGIYNQKPGGTALFI